MTPSLGVFEIPARTRFRRHEHDGLHVCAVMAGGFLERAGRSWVEAAPGTVRISGAARHDIDFSPAGAKCLLLEPADLDAFPRPTSARFLPADPWLAGLLGRLDRTLGSSPSLASEDLAIELLAQIARRMSGRRTPPPPWVERVREMVNDHPGPLSVAHLAVEIGIHRVYLARAFREHCGVSVTGYMRRVRLERARRLIADGAMPLVEVAAAAGFADQSHMTRAMRAALGWTPGGLRRLRAFKTWSGVPR